MEVELRSRRRPYGMILEANRLTENSGVLILFGGLLLVLSSILEFIIGNTFPCVVFGHLGKAMLSNRRLEFLCADLL